MSGIQLVFENGFESPLVENSKSTDILKSFYIDTSREIRYVRLAVKYAVWFNGIWFLDDNQETIHKEVWRNLGIWTYS